MSADKSSTSYCYYCKEKNHETVLVEEKIPWRIHNLEVEESDNKVPMSYALFNITGMEKPSP